MALFRYGDTAFFDSITTDALRFAQAGAEAVGLTLGAVALHDDPTDPDAAVAILLEMPPGHVLGRHAHDCWRVEVIVRGSLDVGDGRVLHPGDVMIAAPREFYGPHKAGADGCLTVEILGAGRGMHGIISPDDDPPEHREQVQRVLTAMAEAKATANG